MHHHSYSNPTSALCLPVIQMRTLSVWTFGILLFTLRGAHGLKSFPENFVVARRNDPHPVTLTCNTQTKEAVSWRLDGEEVEFDNYVQMEGPNLKLSEVDAPMLGEYSCWRGGTRLLSTYLFQEIEENGDLDSLLSCRAKSYDCNFTCSWKDSRFTAVRLGLGHDCSEGQRSCQWESSSGHSGELQFVLPHSLSPYAEESTTLELTAEAINMYYILRRTKTFYLRDIIQPDSPQIVRCQEVGQELNVTVDPPSSWSTPHSFFSLEYEIEYELKDDGKIESSFSTLIPKKISKLRVRSRDSLVLSAWSQWTAWQNVKKGKKNRYRCRKRRHGNLQVSTPGSSDRLEMKPRRHKKKEKQSKSRLI